MEDRKDQQPRHLVCDLQPHCSPQIPDTHAKGAIRIATPRDKSFVVALQRKFSNQLGFLPTPAIDWYLEHHAIHLIEENDQPAGYLLGRSKLAWQPDLRPIYQAAVALDAQRRHLGMALLAVIEQAARAAGQVGMQANCAADIEANAFWRSAGFVQICHLRPPNARGRDIVCWRKPLTRKLPLWFANPPHRAGHHAHHPTTAARKRQ